MYARGAAAFVSTGPTMMGGNKEAELSRGIEMTSGCKLSAQRDQADDKNKRARLGERRVGRLEQTAGAAWVLSERDALSQS